jgi:pimeloyl-ACP methyl ester carboxylesterase
MHRSSLVRRPLSLLLGLALLALPQLVGPARAADKFVKVTFDTVDGVTLQGSFYASPKGKDEPTVLLLHKIGGDSHKDNWPKLAEALQEKGYSVLSFDFRGHGNSTTVDPMKFWSNLYSWNGKLIRGGSLDAKGKPKETISKESFVPGYYPYLVNDVAAAKMFLDERNDAGECNSRSLILIGGDDGAAVGALWMGTEWNRFTADKLIADPRGSLFPPLNVTGVSKDPEGRDQYCALWLSITPRLGSSTTGTSVSASLKTALKTAGKKVPMGFLYGEKDDNGAKHAEEYLKLIKGDDDKLTFTAKQAIKDSKLTGGGLLQQSLDTDKKILTYLEKLREKNVPHKWNKIDVDRTAYVWVLPNAIRPLVAKEEKGKVLEPIPLAKMGIIGP